MPGYSTRLKQTPDSLTWVVLKGHTNNTAGSVTLRSSNPRDTPAINFRHFGEGPIVAKRIWRPWSPGFNWCRNLPPPSKAASSTARSRPVPITRRLKRWPNSCAIAPGDTTPRAPVRLDPRDRGGVLSGDFKVHDTEGLRVVDASVFPRTPGLFIVSAVYMIGEKAADAIIADAKRARR